MIPQQGEECIAELTDIRSDIREKVLQSSVEVVPYDLTLDYSYWPAEHILKVITCAENGTRHLQIVG